MPQAQENGVTLTRSKSRWATVSQRPSGKIGISETIETVDGMLRSTAVALTAEEMDNMTAWWLTRRKRT